MIVTMKVLNRPIELLFFRSYDEQREVASSSEDVLIGNYRDIVQRAGVSNTSQVEMRNIR